MNTEKSYNFTVSDEGIRLDKYISEICPELTRTQAQKLINDGFITVNRLTAKASLKLSEGDSIEVFIPPPSPSTLSPEEIPLKIIFEDNDVLVIDKSAGLTVHPAPGHPDGTLVNAILHHFPRLTDIGDSLRPGIVHRLDKDTSGVMVIAKNSMTQANLSNQFATRVVKKTYLTLVKGHLAPEHGIIEASLGRDPSNRKKMAVVTKGREAKTEYKVVRYIRNYTLLKIKPETGRTHQIRVHLAAIGFPVAGDTTYGVKSPFLSRQFLHACKLAFKLPSTGEQVEFEAELPHDLEQALENIV